MGMSDPAVYLCVSIDCECDKGPRWRVRRPLSFVGVRQGIGERLHPLFARFGARPTYLLSPEVMADDESAELLARLTGAELGTHLHGEHIPPDDKPQAEVTSALQCAYPPSVERAKLANLTALFERRFGRPPVSFRAGRFALGPHSLGYLEELGYAVDSSVTPHVAWTHLAPGLSYRGAWSQPYHPDPARPARHGPSRLLEVPVTIVRPAWSRVPLVGRFAPSRWLRPTRGSVGRLVRLAEREVAVWRRRRPEAPVVLNVMFHNVEVTAGTSPYAVNDRAAARILARLEGLLRWAREAGAGMLGLGDVPAVLAASARGR
jgi:hypothetical protein